MPAFEAVEQVSPNHSFRMKLDGVRVNLKKGLGSFDLFPGTTLFMDEPVLAPKEMELAELYALFGRARRLEFPHIFKISAEQPPEKRLMTVRMAGYHETNLAERFWREHCGKIAVRVSSSADDIQLNNTPMEHGFLVPPPGIDHVVFEAIRGL